MMISFKVNVSQIKITLVESLNWKKNILIPLIDVG